VQSLAPGEEQPQTPVYTGGHPTGRQLCGKRPGGPGGHQVHRTAQVGRDLKRSSGATFCGKGSLGEII